MACVEYKNVSKRFAGGVTAVEDFSLQLDDGDFVVLVGPSGCGKSTALRLMAGLEKPSAGDILIDGQRVNHLDPQQRDIAMVFQNYALYPHKSVRKNMDFPLRMMQVSKEERSQRIAETARLLDLTPWLDRKPKHLSGGQRQRVAMGRALVRDPKVFLMDEPLSNLDAKLRVEIRAEIADLQKRIGITTLYVTHDQVEAMTLGERVAVLRDGRIQQVAAAQTLYDHPVNVFVATFIGSPKMNVFPSRLACQEADHWSVQFGPSPLTLAPERMERKEKLKEQVGQDLLVGLRPEAFVPAEDAPPDRRIPVRIHAVETLGHEQVLYFDAPVDPVTHGAREQGGMEAGEAPRRPMMAARLPARINVASGDEIELGVDTTQAHFFYPNEDAI